MNKAELRKMHEFRGQLQRADFINWLLGYYRVALDKMSEPPGITDVEEIMLSALEDDPEFVKLREFLEDLIDQLCRTGISTKNALISPSSNRRVMQRHVQSLTRTRDDYLRRMVFEPLEQRLAESNSQRRETYKEGLDIVRKIEKKASYCGIRNIFNMLKKARVYRTLGEQAEIFYGVRHKDQDYARTIRLPESITFIEFSTPLTDRYMRFQGARSKEFQAILLADLKAVEKMTERDGKKTIDEFGFARKREERRYYVGFFYTDATHLHLFFDPEKLPRMHIEVCGERAECHERNRTDPDTGEENPDRCHVYRKGRNCDVAREALRKLDLTVNLMNYVSATNLEYEHVKASKHENKRRKEKGLVPKKPFWRRVLTEDMMVCVVGPREGEHSYVFPVTSSEAYYYHCPHCKLIYAKAEDARKTTNCDRCKEYIGKWEIRVRTREEHHKGHKSLICRPSD